MKVEGSTEGEDNGKRASAKRTGHGGDAEKIIRKRGRTRRRVQADSSAIQRLFVACKSVFKGPGTVPPPADVAFFQQLLDKMTPEDVGLNADLLFFKSKGSAKGTPRITHTTIYKCDNFSMVIFFLPPRAVIPLHNHPGMTVFSKLLLGSMHIKSYDWVDPATLHGSTPFDQLQLAKLVVDSDFTAPCDTSILYPTTGGNMHTFTAITACAVLDVLGPPYCTEEGRDCTYYRELPYSDVANGANDHSGLQSDRLCWLLEIDIPKDLKMDGIEYLGPQVIDSS